MTHQLNNTHPDPHSEAGVERVSAIERAVKDAVENGGYSVIPWNLIKGAPDTFHFNAIIFEVFLDPLFWQALGKARGWAKKQPRQIQKGEWKWQWHRFIDHLADGKDAESFFASLSKQPLK